MLMKYSRISTLKFPGGCRMGLGQLALMYQAGGPPNLGSSSQRGGVQGWETGKARGPEEVGEGSLCIICKIGGCGLWCHGLRGLRGYRFRPLRRAGRPWAAPPLPQRVSLIPRFASSPPSPPGLSTGGGETPALCVCVCVCSHTCTRVGKGGVASAWEGHLSGQASLLAC